MALHTIEVAREEIAKIYIAAFNRVPDAGGLSNWMNQYMAGLMTYEQIAADFANQPEYTAKYPSIMTDSEYITQIYLNVFGRIPDPGGLVNWVNQIANPAVSGITRGSVMQEMLLSAAAPGNSDGLRLANQAEFGVQSILDGVPTATATAQLANITADAATVTAATAAVAGEAGGALGETFTLTKGIDDKTGTANNDTFVAAINGTDGSELQTMNALDTLDGSTGIDTLKISSSVAGLQEAALGTLKKIEVIQIASTAAIGVAGVSDARDGVDNNNATVTNAFDVSNIADLTSVKVTLATDVALKASGTANVTVSGATGAIDVDGGLNVSISDATANKDITVGNIVAAATDVFTAGTAAKGTITVTDTKQGSGVITVDGGTDVTVTTTTDKGSSGTITVGSTKAATGNVIITQNTTNDAAMAIAAGDISVTGGKTVTVNLNATNTATKDSGAANNITAGSVQVTANTDTTAVTINQTMIANDYAAVVSNAKKESTTLTFGSLKAGEKVAVSEGAGTLGTDLTFTAAKDLTADEVAAAFASLTAADIQASGGKVANGVFDGTLDAGWTSATASGATVVFTGATNVDKTNLQITTRNAGDTDVAIKNTDFKVVTVDGSAGTSTTARDVTADYGNVRIDGSTALATITLNGYDSADLGVTGADLDALKTLSIANSAGTTALATAATSLDLTVNKITGTLNISGASAAVATLNVTTVGEDSAITLVAANVKDLNVAGDKVANLTGSTLSVLENVKVTGTAGLNLGTISASKSIDTTGTTGAVTSTLGATTTTYAGGSGADTLTVGVATTKALTLGAGNDTVVISSAVGASGSIDGGDGSDILSMTAANAVTFSGGTTFEAGVSNFEKVKIAVATAANQAIDMANLDDINYVISAGGAIGAAAVSEVQTLNFAGITAGADGNFTIAGVTVAVLAGDTTQDIADKVVTALNAVVPGTAIGDATASNAAGTSTTVTITYLNTAGDVAQASATNGTATLSGLPVAATTTTGSLVVTAADLDISNLASGGTLELTGVVGATSTVAVKDAATGDADSLNVILTSTGAITNTQALTVANVETFNITATDTAFDTTKGQTLDTHTFDLVATSAKTIKITGNAGLTLTAEANNVKLTSIDGSEMTGALTATANGVVGGTTILGGSGNDVLTAIGENDILKGNAGNDTFYATDLTKIYGGAGADKFYFAVNSQLAKVSTVNDVGSGDVFYLKDNGTAGAGTVVSKFYASGAEYNVNTTTTFEAKVNAALVQTGEGEVSWFQHGGNTYIVIDANDGSNIAAGAADTYSEGQDIVIEIIGTVDLSTASFNSDFGTLEIA